MATYPYPMNSEGVPNPRLPAGTPLFYPGSMAADVAPRPPIPGGGPAGGGAMGGGAVGGGPAGGPPPASAWDPINAWLQTQNPEMVANWRQQMQAMPQATGDRYRFMQQQMARYGGGGAAGGGAAGGGAAGGPVGSSEPAMGGGAGSVTPARPPIPRGAPNPRVYRGRWRSPEARAARRAGGQGINPVATTMPGGQPYEPAGEQEPPRPPVTGRYRGGGQGLGLGGIGRGIGRNMSYWNPGGGGLSGARQGYDPYGNMTRNWF